MCNNAAVIKQIRAAISPFFAYPNCKHSQRIYSDKCKSAQSYKLPKLTDNAAAIAAITALNIPGLQKLRIFKAINCYRQPSNVVRFTLPR